MLEELKAVVFESAATKRDRLKGEKARTTTQTVEPLEEGGAEGGGGAGWYTEAVSVA